MKKRVFQIAEGVSNIELFYDLIFVYCIGAISSLCHHVEGGFLTWETWLHFTFCLAVVLQVWLFTTFLMNRYGDQSASDNICLFINMFFLYFLVSGVRSDWHDSILTFNLSWALILANLIVHWTLKLWRYENLDTDDRHIMIVTIIVLAVELILATVAAFLPPRPCAILSWIAMLFGASVFTQSRICRRKPSRFDHLTERCALLVIVAFGETVVTIASNISDLANFRYSVLEFALIVGLFLIYIFEHDNMIDRHRNTDGMRYLSLTGWIIAIICNLNVALEYMPDPSIALVPKSIFLTACLVLYLLTSFALGAHNKPEFRYSRPYVIGRLVICAVIIIVAVATDYNEFINLICQTLCVFGALLHEWLLFRSRTQLHAFNGTLHLGSSDRQEPEPELAQSGTAPDEGDQA